MSRASNPRVIEEHRIAHLEGSAAKKAIILPFGVREMDERLPGGGLPYGALHEIAGGGAGTVDGAAAALFAAAARSKGKVLWCLTRPDLFFPAIAQAGLHPGRVIFCEGDKEEDVLASMEEGLSFWGWLLLWANLCVCRWSHPGGCSWLREDGDHGPRCPQMAASD